MTEKLNSSPWGSSKNNSLLFSQRQIRNPDEVYDSMILFFHQLENGGWKADFYRDDR